MMLFIVSVPEDLFIVMFGSLPSPATPLPVQVWFAVLSMSIAVVPVVDVEVFVTVMSPWGSILPEVSVMASVPLKVRVPPTVKTVLEPNVYVLAAPP